MTASSSPAAAEILVVEDDAVSATLLGHILRGERYHPEITGTLREARQLFAARRFDLVLLDINLPDGSGLDLCHDFRAESPVPIIMVTSENDEDVIVPALEQCADDYVIKPFNVRELLARIRIALRRGASDVAAPDTGQATDGTADSGHVRIDHAQQIAVVNGEDVALTPIEYRILHTLLDQPGATVSTAAMVRAVWGYENAGEEALVRMHITRLRKKLGARCGHQDHVLNRRGVGYRFIVDPLR